VAPIRVRADRLRSGGQRERKPVKKVVYWEKFGRDWPFAAEQPDLGWQDRWIAAPKD